MTRSSVKVRISLKGPGYYELYDTQGGGGRRPALAAVYAPYTETGLTFESPAPTPEEFTARITDTLKGYPFLVCERDGRPVGYAYAHRYRPRAAYDWDAELSVYLEQGCTGRGLGRALYGALLDLLKAQGYVNIYGTVSVPNPPSERLHESMGFRLVYTDLKTGWKLGRWRDLAFYRLQLRPYEDAPAPSCPSRSWTRPWSAASASAARRR